MPRHSDRRTLKRMKKILAGLGVVIALFFMLRAIAEPFMIEMSDPATYRNDWGGPSLAGVLAVHCGPGIVAALLLATAVVHRRRRSR